MIQWIRTSRLSINNSLSLKALLAEVAGLVEGCVQLRILLLFFITLKPRVD